MDLVKSWALKAGVSLLVGKIMASSLHGRRHAFDDRTECIGEDYELYHLFKSLQKYHEVNPAAYESVIVNADRLLHLRLVLSRNEVQPTLNDRPMAFSYFTNSKDNMERMLNCAKADCPAKTVVCIYNLYKKISENLEGHWLSILKMTTDVI